MKLNELYKSSIILETRTPNQILMELNVINIPDIDNYLKRIGKDLPTEDTLKWFLSRGKKHIVNAEDQNTVINQFSANAEPWMVKANKRGDVLYRFSPTPNLDTQLNHVVDYIRAMSDTVSGQKNADQQSKSQAAKKLKGIANMSMAQVIDASEKWTSALSAKKGNSLYLSAEEEDGLEPVLDLGAYKWYKLTSASCLDREGRIMGHCVGSYSDRVESGGTEIYSLRDANNMSRVTIEIYNGSGNFDYDGITRLIQIKGKQNEPPVEKYHDDVITLLNTLKPQPRDSGMSDLRRMGLLWNEANGKYGRPEDISEITYDNKGIKIYDWGEGKQLNYNGKKICYIGPRSGYGRDLELFVEPSNISTFSSADINTANKKIEDPYYKLSSFIVATSEVKNDFGLPLFISSDILRIDPKLKKYFFSYDAKKIDANADSGQIFAMNVDAVGKLESKKEYTIDGKYYEVRINTIPNHTKDDTYPFFVNGEEVGTLSEDGKKGQIGQLKDTDRPQFSLEGVVKTDDYEFNLVLAMKSFVNEKKVQERPIIYGDVSITQNPETFEVVDRDSADFEKVMNPRKFGNISVWKEVYGHSQLVYLPNNRYPDESRLMYTIRVGTTKSNGLVLAVDGDNNLFSIKVNNNDVITQNTEDFINALNSSQITKFFANPKNDSGIKANIKAAVKSALTDLQRYEIYWNPNKQVFSEGLLKSGDRYRPNDDFLAIKTVTTLHVYQNEKQIVYFNLDRYKMSYETIDSLKLIDKISFTNNSKVIADILNHYKIERQESSSRFNNVNKELAGIGIIYTQKNGWTGQKSTGKEIESNDDYSINQYKNSLIIKNNRTNQVLASTSAVVTKRSDGTQRKWYGDLELQKENIYHYSKEDLDILFKALSSFKDNQNDVISLGYKPSTGNRYDTSLYDVKKLKNSAGDRPFGTNADMYFDHQAAIRGYTPGEFRKNEEFTKKEIISKGKGGTWVKEKISPVDLSIQGWERGVDLSKEKPDGESGVNWKNGDEEYKVKYSGDKHTGHNPFRWQDNYTLYFNKKPILRLLTLSNEQSDIYHIIDDFNITKLDTVEKFRKFSHELSRLYKTEDLPTSDEMKSVGLFIDKKGNLSSMDDNPKLNSFRKGMITYEDGSSWKRVEKSGWRGDPSRDLWTLYRPAPNETNEKRHDFTDNQGIIHKAIMVLDVIKDDIDKIGIDNITFYDSEVKRNTKIYRPFLLDIMDIIDEYHAISFK